jgi:hypothetical protein
LLFFFFQGLVCWRNSQRWIFLFSFFFFLYLYLGCFCHEKVSTVNAPC